MVRHLYKLFCLDPICRNRFLEQSLCVKMISWLTFFFVVFDLQTSSFFLHIYKVKFMDKRIKTGERQPSELCFASMSLLLSEQVPFAGEDLSV